MSAAHINKQRGFTIIEVVLVLAIAALIFLMVFIALPSLQKSQRDTQRRDDLGRISTQVTNYQSANRGKIPSETQFVQATTGFVVKYLDGVDRNTAGDTFSDPSKGGYKFVVGSASPSDGTISYTTDAVCGSDGATAAGSARNYALRVKLEGQTSFYCIDNK